MPERPRVIVIGVGAMGSAAIYQLAKRGFDVLGLDRFDIPHHHGSSHGYTRIIRLAYFEHPSYVPLLRRAYELWRELERETAQHLLWITGSIDAGEVFEDSLKSCRLHSLPHELLTGTELRQRFPGYHLPADIDALFQPEGGFLTPEACISAHLMIAERAGAEIHGRETAVEWQALGSGVRVRTNKAAYDADYLVIAAGAWVAQLVTDLAGITVPERQVLAWLQPRLPEFFLPARFPVFNLRVREGHFYGFPEFGVPGFKFGRYHHRHEVVDPDTMRREADDEDERLLRSFAEKYFPGGAGPTLALHTCMFTNTPDEHFILDFHPDSSRVIVASPCSGHGFKFSSVIGEILADLVQGGETKHDISMHRLARFGPKDRARDHQ